MSELNNPFKYYAVSAIILHKEDRHASARVKYIVAARTAREAEEEVAKLFENNPVITLSEQSIQIFELDDPKIYTSPKVLL